MVHVSYFICLLELFLYSLQAKHLHTKHLHTGLTVCRRNVYTHRWRFAEETSEASTGNQGLIKECTTGSTWKSKISLGCDVLAYCRYRFNMDERGAIANFSCVDCNATVLEWYVGGSQMTWSNASVRTAPFLASKHDFSQEKKKKI